MIGNKGTEGNVREFSGLDSNLFMSPEQAVQTYKLEQRPPSLLISSLETQLYERGIATIEIPISGSDFEVALKGYEVCLQECPTQLKETYHSVDKRFGNDAGQVRKNRKFHSDGSQIQDPKNYFHFNEYARKLWKEQFSHPPAALKEFLEAGYEIHDALIRVAHQQFGQLEETHPNIQRAYYQGQLPDLISHSYLRLLRYDGYEPQENMGDVAKPHFDIGGATIQGYADAPGFWGAIDGPKGERTHYDTETGFGYFFMGMGHRKLYGKDAAPRPLYHGVDRVIPAGASWVPERHAVILFIDAPMVDYGVKAEDTVPYGEHSPYSKTA